MDRGGEFPFRTDGMVQRHVGKTEKKKTHISQGIIWVPVLQAAEACNCRQIQSATLGFYEARKPLEECSISFIFLPKVLGPLITVQLRITSVPHIMNREEHLLHPSF